LAYNMIYEGDDECGWSAFVPDLPGVAAAGNTREERRT
jgi:predicted RNase H-like HicB family nuclease